MNCTINVSEPSAKAIESRIQCTIEIEISETNGGVNIGAKSVLKTADRCIVLRQQELGFQAVA